MLAFDIGNGSVKYALFRGEEIAASGRIPLPAEADLPDDDPEGVAAVSVNAPVLARLRLRYPGLRAAGEDFPMPLPVRYDPASSLGADRILGVFGALESRPGAAAVLLLDAGTCLTATVGSRREGVTGGAILPGVDLLARALHEGTAHLPLVSYRPPRDAIGASTEESIRSGLYAASVGAARDLVARIRAESRDDLCVVAAGTGAEALARSLPEIDAVLPLATLVGLRRAAAVG